MDTIYVSQLAEHGKYGKIEETSRGVEPREISASQLYDRMSEYDPTLGETKHTIF